MIKNKLICFVYILLILCCILILPLTAKALDRCREFIPEVRANSIRYLGPDYPWWYNLGCAMAETTCRADLVSFDGGIGLYQFTPSTGVLAVIEKEFPVNPYDAESSIKAQAFYISIIKDKYMKQKSIKFKNKYQIEPLTFTNKCGTRLSDLYRYYNGGYWFIYESKLADSTYACEEKDMREHCVRSGTWVGTKNPRWLSFCEVNYSYATKVYNYGQKYKVGNDEIGFWRVIPKKEAELPKPEIIPIKENKLPKPDKEDKSIEITKETKNKISIWDKILNIFHKIFG